MLKTERQDAIVAEVWRRGTVSVADLAARLGVSEITIRRDIDELGALGRLQRIRGGARRLMPRDPEPPAVQRQAECAEEKRAIGLAALGLVHDGDVIAIESGSTTLELARAIAGRAWRLLQVVTNSFTVLNELLRVPGVQVVFAGGAVNADEMGTYGALAEETLKRLNIDRLFLSCRAIDPRTGLSNDLQAGRMVGVERAFVAASRQVIVLADHTKFGRVFLMQIVPATDIDIVVTDDLTSPDVLEELSRQDTQVVVAPVAGAKVAHLDSALADNINKPAESC